MKKVLSVFVMIIFSLCITQTVISNAKAITKIADGGYISDYEKAQIKGKKLILKGEVANWERSPDTPSYSKTGTFKFKLSKNCEIIDGYRETEENISVESFNELCDNHDSDHSCIAFVIKKNKVSVIRFW